MAAQIKGNSKITIEYINQSIGDDGTKSRTKKISGEISSVLAEYNSAVGQFVVEDERDSSFKVSGATFQKNEDGTAVCMITESTQRGGSGSGGSSAGTTTKEKTSQCSITLSQVPLIQHKKFRNIPQGGNISWSLDSENYEMPIMKAIQEYLSVQGSADERVVRYAKELYNSLTGVENVDLFLKKTLAGVSSYMVPSATFSITKTCTDAIPEDAGGTNIGKLDSLPSPFGSLNSGWSVLSSGSSVSYSNTKKSGTYTKTWIGIPKDDGGGWDNDLYS